MRKFLLISYSFPPMGVVGSLRPYRLCRYLPEKGWIPEVITVTPRKGIHLDYSLSKYIPESVRVHRTRKFDPLTIYNSLTRRIKDKKCFGSGPLGNENLTGNVNSDGIDKGNSFIKRLKRCLIGILSTPDHQVFWNIFLIMAGIGVLIREKQIEFIFTSSPPHSSQLGGAVLSLLLRKPLIVDYRDPWNDIFHKEISNIRHKFEMLLEWMVINRATKVVSSTEAYSNMLKKRFSKISKDKFVTITNSYEEDKFIGIKPVKFSRFTMGYLGIFYPHQEPYLYFNALSECLRRFPNIRENLNVKLIGEVDEVTLGMLEEKKLHDVVEVTGRMMHESAIRTAMSCDLLLLLMGSSELTPKGWVPSKVFEYFACRKPILAVVPEGEAARLIRKTRTGYVITSNDREKVIEVIMKEYRKWENGSCGEADLRDEEEVNKFSNKYTIERFRALFEAVCWRGI